MSDDWQAAGSWMDLDSLSYIDDILMKDCTPSCDAHGLVSNP